MKRLFALCLIIVIATALVLSSVASAFAGGLAVNHRYKVLTVGQDKVTGLAKFVDPSKRNAPAFYTRTDYGYNEVAVWDNILHQQVPILFYADQIKPGQKVPRTFFLPVLTPAGRLQFWVMNNPTYFLVP